MNKKKTPTQEEVVKNFLVLLDGEQWRAKSVAIARRGHGHDYYVQLIIVDMQDEEYQEYFVEYESLVISWLGLNMGKRVFDHLNIEMNLVIWKANSLSRFQDGRGRKWIQLDIEHGSSGQKHSLAIERESMTDAFHALSDDIDDVEKIVQKAFKVLRTFLTS